MALILHCLTYPDNPAGQMVSSDTMAGAIQLVEYFRSHAQRVLTHFGVAAIATSGGLAARVLKALGNDGEIAKTVLYNRLGFSVPAATLDGALAELEALGLAEKRVQKQDGRGRPSEFWKRL